MSPSRRQVLGGGFALASGYVLGGCGGKTGSSKPKPTPTPPPTLSPAGIASVGNEHDLLAAYDAVVLRFPALAGVLAVPRAHHRDHLAALGAPATPSATPYTVPATQRAAVQALLVLEQAAAAQRQGAAIGDLAFGSVLASIAASEAVHVDLLTLAVPTVPATA